MSTGQSSHPSDTHDAPRSPARIAIGIDGHREGQDAAVLGAMIARATGAELLLVAVHPDPLIVLPAELGWVGLHKQAEELLRDTRDSIARGARTVVETDWSVPRALGRVVEREHRDLLVVGSSRDAPEGRMRIGTRTRQLLCHCPCALAVSPRGLSTAPERRLARIAVGYDGSPEAGAALALAGSIAVAGHAELHVRAVVDDRIPDVGWSRSKRESVMTMWDQLLEPAVESLGADARAAVDAIGADAQIEVRRGQPARALGELCDEVDLLVIGSRRWGAVARVLLGSTGEALMRDASCPVLVVPTPAA